MAFNISEVNIEVYFTANVAVSAVLFMFLATPPLLLCLLCVIALIIADKLNKKIRLLLINIFAAEICNLLTYAASDLGWAPRLLYDDNVSCRLLSSLIYVASVQKFTAEVIYALNIYFFIKHGEKKLKWSVIIPFIVISWILAAAFGSTAYFNDLGTDNVNGFCKANIGTVSFKVIAAVVTTIATSSIIIEVTCCILTNLFIKRNVLEDNADVKKAVNKVLVYLVAVSILTFINTVLPFLGPYFFPKGTTQTLQGTLITNYGVRLFFNMLAFATPIVGIVFLKPVRAAIKTMSKKLCMCFNLVRSVPPAGEG